MAIHDVECCEECAVHDEVVQSVRGMLPDDDDLYDLAELFKVFALFPPHLPRATDWRA